MTVSIRSPNQLWTKACSDLAEHPEVVGFFLADFDVGARAFNLIDWRPVPPDGYENAGPYHVALTDEAQAEAIRWAWESNSCLVEAHSHGEHSPAAFSNSDLSGFEDWVPHVMWRLRGRPYGALVAAGATFDGLAWVDGSDRPEEATRIEIDDGSVVELARETWGRIRGGMDGPSEYQV
jgi:hypothetical protein